MSDTKAEGKKIVLVTALPNGERLAVLRDVESMDGGQVVMTNPDRDRSDSIPAADCVNIKGGELVAEGGLGLGVRELSIGDLTTSSDSNSDAPGLLEVFSVDPGAPLYVVRGGDRRGELHGALREALPGDPIVVSCGPGYRIEALDEEQMNACGWVSTRQVEALKEKIATLKEEVDGHQRDSDQQKAA